MRHRFVGLLLAWATLVSGSGSLFSASLFAQIPMPSRTAEGKPASRTTGWKWTSCSMIPRHSLVPGTERETGYCGRIGH